MELTASHGIARGAASSSQVRRMSPVAARPRRRTRQRSTYSALVFAENASSNVAATLHGPPMRVLPPFRCGRDRRSVGRALGRDRGDEGTVDLTPRALIAVRRRAAASGSFASDRQDLSGLFGDRNEGVRGDDPAGGMAPNARAPRRRWCALRRARRSAGRRETTGYCRARSSSSASRSWEAVCISDSKTT
jgi:hypothetical protein